jgi:PAS domain S-box-containing protein
LETRQDVNLLFIRNYSEGFDRLQAKTVDAIAADINVAAYLIEKKEIRGLAIVGKPFATAPAAIAVRKGNTALLNEINKALAQLKLEGSIAEIEAHWKPYEMLFFSRGRVRQLLTLAMACLGVLMVGAMGAWIMTLRKQIKRRKMAEVAMRESEQRLRTLSDASFEGIAVSEDGLLVDANDQLLKMLGYPKVELLGKPVLDLVAPESRDLVRSVIQSGRPDPYEHLALRKDGTVFTVEVCGRTIATSPHLVRVTAIRDISERKLSEEKMRASREELRALAGRLQAVREEERTRIAREIHDVLAQDLTRLKIDLGWLKKRVSAAERLQSDAVSAKIAQLNTLADATINTVQKIAAELRPVVLDSLGLPAALEWQAEDFQSRTGIQCEAILPKDDIELSREAATGIFRIVQESLTNVIRHSEATRVEIALETGENHLRLLVRDNGVGFDQSRMKDVHSLGLLGMRERALLLNAQFEIRGEKGKGTEVRVVVPLMRSEFAGHGKDAHEKTAVA